MDGEKFDLEQFPTSESAKRMLSYVTPGFYDNSYVGKWLYQVMGLEYDDARKLAEELQYQMFPETATWGLMYHEIKWGLPVRTNLSYEERRQLIYQKRDYKAPMTPYRMETYLKMQPALMYLLPTATIQVFIISSQRTRTSSRHILPERVRWILKQHMKCWQS